MNEPTVELERIESDLLREERSLQQHLTRLGAEASAVETRARAALALASSIAAEPAVLARLSGVTPPPLAEGAAALTRARKAREWAVRERLDAAQGLRELLSASHERLVAAAAQLRRDEDLVQQLQADARRRADQVARERAAAPAPLHRRASKRVPVRAAVDFSSDDNFFTGFSANLSEGGVFVATCGLLPVGTEVDLSFTLPTGAQVRTLGVVRWVRENDDKAPEVFPGIGVQFSQLDAQAAAEIHRFIAERDPMFYPD